MEYRESFVGAVYNDRYEIVNVIGKGGMAFVLGAIDRYTGQVVAIKQLDEKELLELDCDERQAAIDRFINEAQVMKNLSHPGIAKVYETYFSDKLKFFVMEYLEAANLADQMTHYKSLNIYDTVDYAIQILSVLDYIHRNNIIHCDIKPHNILLLNGEKIKIIDFGISKSLINEKDQSPSETAVGTVDYISPEQAQGLPIDGRSDLYSLGDMLYEMTTGELPFITNIRYNNAVTVARMQIAKPPKPPRSLNANIPVGLEQIILKAMEKKPENRYSSAREMLDAIIAFRENPSITFDYNLQSAEKQTEMKTEQLPTKQTGYTTYSVLGVATAFILVMIIAVSLIFGKILSERQSGGYLIEVPEITGYEYSDSLINALDQDYFEIKTVYVLSEKKEYTVVKQSPRAYSKQQIIPEKQKCVITITVNVPSLNTTMKDYSVLNAENVENLLKTAGYSVTVTESYSSFIPLGKVISTYPSAGESIKYGSDVTICVSIGSLKVETNNNYFYSLNNINYYIDERSLFGLYNIRENNQRGRRSLYCGSVFTV